MTLDQTLKLLDAGYTKDEIRDMIDAEKMPETAVDQAEPETVLPDPEPEPEPAHRTEPVTEDPQIKALTKQINDLVSAIQRSNLLHSQQPQQPEKTAEDVLAEVIRPTRRSNK